MYFIIFIYFLFISIIYTQKVECKINTTSTEECPLIIRNLYLDIVFVFDSSYGANEHGFTGQLLSISGFLNSGFIIEQGNKIQSTRVSYISMASKTLTFSNLTTYNSVNEAISGLYELSFNANTGPIVNLYSGLMAANNQLDMFKRDGFKQLIVIFSSETEVDCSESTEMLYQNSSLNIENPCRAASIIKSEGKDILVVNLNYHDAPPPEIKHIASPNYDIPNDDNLIGNLQKLASYSNCNCPKSYTQFTDIELNFKGRTCAYFEDSTTFYYVAVQKIQGIDSRLIQIRSEIKQKFAKSLCEKDDCFFGLNQLNESGKWKWDGSDIDFNPKEYDNFGPGEEKKIGCGYIENTTGKWFSTDCHTVEKKYAIEILACDTENFCLL
ncbi:C-type lectin domain and von Willebrand factor, type A domain and C-type lectin-like domain and C-type lectin fold domain-containing protein [Strongyloides ratti]|uniref:C-type lectin domain and von Willebrand factor, type A domain and C-type lectin-like domain and C-type lectin fold domain-containing protein n=1 Tax=Strongyloides ratti TaxID=34506 RepID=A0A090L9G2_STRRB|nr:C-type lectin domain and von Willebrand factor, type A domain and C-type lectin-like domain and C-type lectin fold domain-containing protein [Strongyloides ratti]CEF64145.1 C-type lectin domain and von Willebrand factor, type A domain and C-type lectin-like domain and C-type lectin fold domain-containing protein [Strongyloides ratti]